MQSKYRVTPKTHQHIKYIFPCTVVVSPILRHCFSLHVNFSGFFLFLCPHHHIFMFPFASVDLVCLPHCNVVNSASDRQLLFKCDSVNKEASFCFQMLSLLFCSCHEKNRQLLLEKTGLSCSGVQLCQLDYVNTSSYQLKF